LVLGIIMVLVIFFLPNGILGWFTGKFSSRTERVEEHEFKNIRPETD
jgi:hypothetical protein